MKKDDEENDEAKAEEEKTGGQVALTVYNYYFS